MNGKIAGLGIVALLVAVGSSFMLLQFLNANTASIVGEESIEIVDSCIWFGADSSKYPYAEVLIINNKNVAATIQRLAFRGVDCRWNDIYYLKGEIGAVSTQSKIEPDLAGTSIEITLEGKERTLQQASGRITLEPYKELVLYIRNPGDLGPSELPSGKITIAIYTEKNVDLGEPIIDTTDIAIGKMSTEEIKILYVEFTPDQSFATLTVKNTGTAAVVITEAYISSTLAPSDLIPSGQTLEPNDILELSVAGNFAGGQSYQFKIVTLKGNAFVYTATAPL